MKIKAAILIFSLTSLYHQTYAAVGKPVENDPQPEVTVDAFAVHSKGKIVYHYRVINNSPNDVSSITIGIDNKNNMDPSDDVYELTEMPSGWNMKFGIPSSSFNGPNGWRASVSRPEKIQTLAITWEPLNANVQKLLSGQLMNKMSIAIDKPDPNYLMGHALAIFSTTTPSSLTVPIGNLDKTPPEFTVTLTPDFIQSTENKLLPVKASFFVKDDFDHKPEIKLESITANEEIQPEDISDATIGLDDRYILLKAAHTGEADRVYTVTYSATDASGNQTLASANVTVPNSHPEITILPVFP